jgi:hypothetical protein
MNITDVDYGDFDYIEKNEANGALKQAKRLLKIIDSVRKKLIKEMKLSLSFVEVERTPFALS